MPTYCVWYRVQRPVDREAETLVHAMQARLACRTGVAGRLLKKRDAPDTWMELYEVEADAAGFERQLQSLADQFDLEMFIDGARHVECFLADTVEPPRACGMPG